MGAYTLGYGQYGYGYYLVESETRQSPARTPPRRAAAASRTSGAAPALVAPSSPLPMSIVKAVTNDASLLTSELRKQLYVTPQVGVRPMHHISVQM